MEFEKKSELDEEKKSKLAKGEKRKPKELHCMQCPKCDMELMEIDYQPFKVEKRDLIDFLSPARKGETKRYRHSSRREKRFIGCGGRKKNNLIFWIRWDMKGEIHPKIFCSRTPLPGCANDPLWRPGVLSCCCLPSSETAIFLWCCASCRQVPGYRSYWSINFRYFASSRSLSNSQNFFTISSCSLLLKYFMDGVKKPFSSFSICPG
jgi:hypothetical protein